MAAKTPSSRQSSRPATVDDTVDIVVRDFVNGDELVLNKVVGVRALHDQRSKVAARMNKKLGGNDGYRVKKFDPYEGDPNPGTLFGDHEAVAEVTLLREKLRKQVRDAEDREAARHAMRKTLVAREEPKWRRKNMRQQFAKERAAAQQDIAQMKRDHERMLAKKLVDVNLLK